MRARWNNAPATAADYNGATLSWKWSYTINGGAPVVFQSGTGTVPAVSYTYPTGSGGSNFVWTITVGDGVTNISSQLAVGVEVPPAPGTGLTFAATNGVLGRPPWWPKMATSTSLPRHLRQPTLPPVA